MKHGALPLILVLSACSDATLTPSTSMVTSGPSSGPDATTPSVSEPDSDSDGGMIADPDQSPGALGCSTNDDCDAEQICTLGACTLQGTGEAGDDCGADSQCQRGFRCALGGLSGRCVEEGVAGIGDDCDSPQDCLGGLACLDGSCQVATQIEPWSGEVCAVPSEASVRAYFEVPGSDQALEGDFFRLPYPNDLRLMGGSVDLSGFPSPGEGALGDDIVARYVAAIEDTESGFGNYSSVLFRFSGSVDLDGVDIAAGHVAWIDVTPGIDDADRDDVGAKWQGSSGAAGRGKYLCPNWIGVRRPDGKPMLGGRTYAVVLTTDIRAEDGAAIERAENLSALLDESAPDEAVLEDAWQAYGPLRDYLETSDELGADDVLNAAVFTVADPAALMKQLAAAVYDAELPTASDWASCDDGDTSPCPQADGERACGEASDAFAEYHALLEIPVFQRGQAPYLTPQDGGDIDADGPVRNESICVSLAVPRADAPAEGWPLVVFGHGTGGSFRSALSEDVAGALSEIDLPNDEMLRFAVLGFDAVQHGPRRGDSDESPEQLFFNFGNPKAARGNPLQGAADVISLGRYATDGLNQGDGAPIDVNPDGVVYFGHSQGATHGSLALPYAGEYRGVVLSGNGGSLINALLDKRNPIDIAAAVPFALQDFDAQGELPGGEFHPVLSLLQHWVDAADPLNFASALVRGPDAEGGKHVLQTYGLGDTFSPPSTMRAFAVAGRLTEVEPDGSVGTPDELSQAQTDNREAAPYVGAELTQAVRQYENDAGDGHFVAFDVSSARRDVREFLGMAALGLVPQVGR